MYALFPFHLLFELLLKKINMQRTCMFFQLSRSHKMFNIKIRNNEI